MSNLNEINCGGWAQFCKPTIFMLFFSGFWVSLCVRERERERESREQRENLEMGGKIKNQYHFFHTVTQGPFTRMVLWRKQPSIETQEFWKKSYFEKKWFPWVLFKEKGFGSKDPMVFIEMTKVLRKEGLYWKHFCVNTNLKQKEFNKRIYLKKKFPWVFILRKGV